MDWNFDEALQDYRVQGAPGDQLALKNLLAEVQSESGGSIPLWALSRIADAYGVKETFLLAVIKRSPSLHADTGTHLLEICCGSGCSKRGHLAEFVEKTYGKNPAGFTVKQTPCMHMCGQGPILRWDGKLYCGADEALIRSLTGTGAAGSEPVPEQKEKPKKEEKPKKSDREESDRKEKKDKKKDKKKDDRKDDHKDGKKKKKGK